MLLLFSLAALLEAFRLSSLSALTNCDIWWHLNSGLWILQNHAFPREGLFSQVSAQAWSASSWGYEVLLALAYKVLGLRAIPLFLMCFRAALAVLTFLLARGMRGRFWPAVVLSLVAQYVLGPMPPGPAYFSILFFAIELLLLLEARRRGSIRLLWWFVPLFLAWANFHPQFVYGIVVLILFVGALAIEKSSVSDVQKLGVASAGKIIGVSIAATAFTPYFWGPYAVFFRTTFSSANPYLPEFQALGFRQAQDYLLLLLVMAAFLTLGLRQSRDVFQIALLAGCLGLAFYSRRDIWLVTMAALAVIGDVLANAPSEVSVANEQAELETEALVEVAETVPRGLSSEPQRLKPQSSGRAYGTSGTRALPETADRALPKTKHHSSFFAIAITAGFAVGIVLVVFALRVPRDREALLAKAGLNYPVAACDYIRGHRLPQPLFNAYEWGGFLTWYMPEYPVAIDSRTDLYGGDAIAGYSKMMNAEVRYTEYPALANARTILLPKKANMAIALASVPRFQVAYSDDVAVVLARSDVP